MQRAYLFDAAGGLFAKTAKNTRNSRESVAKVRAASQDAWAAGR